jgi:hypothetical protein
LYILLYVTSSICEIPDDTTFAVQAGARYLYKFDKDFKFIWAYFCGFPPAQNINMLQYANNSIYVQTGGTRITRIDLSGQELESISSNFAQYLTAVQSIEYRGSAVFPNGDLIFTAPSLAILSFIEGDTLTPPSNISTLQSHLLLRVDSNLNLIWAKYFSGFRFPHGIYLPTAVGSDEQIYLIGQVTDTLIIQSDTIIGNQTNVGTTTIYKVSGAGEGIWARAFGNMHQVQPSFMYNVSDGSGLYFSGLYTGNLELQGYEINNSKGTAFLVKYDYDGNIVNFFNFSGGANRALSIASDNNSSFYVGGIVNRNPIPVFSCEPRTPNAGFYLARFTEEPDEAPQPSIIVDGIVLTATPTFSGTIQWFLNDEPIPGANAQTFTATENGNYTVRYAYETGCISSATSDVSNVIVSNIQALNNNAFEIFPNPANHTLFIKTQSNAPISISDLSGKQLMSFQNGNTTLQMIDISALANGVYLIRQGASCSKFLKQ